MEQPEKIFLNGWLRLVNVPGVFRVDYLAIRVRDGGGTRRRGPRDSTYTFCPCSACWFTPAVGV